MGRHRTSNDDTRTSPEGLTIAGCCRGGCCSTPSRKRVVGEKRPPSRRGALAGSSCYWRSPTGGWEGRRDSLMDLVEVAGGNERESGGTPGNSPGGGGFEGKRHGTQPTGRALARWSSTGAPHGRARHCHSISARHTRSCNRLPSSQHSLILLLAYHPRPLGSLHGPHLLLLYPRRSLTCFLVLFAQGPNSNPLPSFPANNRVFTSNLYQTSRFSCISGCSRFIHAATWQVDTKPR